MDGATLRAHRLGPPSATARETLAPGKGERGATDAVDPWRTRRPARARGTSTPPLGFAITRAQPDIRVRAPDALSQRSRPAAGPRGLRARPRPAHAPERTP